MGRSSYTQSVSTSTRTFQTAPPAAESPASKSDTETAKRLSRSRSRLARRLPWLIVVVLIAMSLFLFMQYREAKAKLASPQAAQANTKQVKDTLAKVAKLVIVPTDETPTVVTVADPAKLKTQTFFVHAKTGDKVIVYAKAKEAILYRPSTNQIVTMAPVTGSGN